MARQKIDIPQDQIADFCKRWQVSELALFGAASVPSTDGRAPRWPSSE